MKELEKDGECGKALDGDPRVGCFLRQGEQRSDQERAATPGAWFSTVLSPVTNSLGRLGLERPAAGLGPRPRALAPRNKEKGLKKDGGLFC